MLDSKSLAHWVSSDDLTREEVNWLTATLLQERDWRLLHELLTKDAPDADVVMGLTRGTPAQMADLLVLGSTCAGLLEPVLEWVRTAPTESLAAALEDLANNRSSLARPLVEALWRRRGLRWELLLAGVLDTTDAEVRSWVNRESCDREVHELEALLRRDSDLKAAFDLGTLLKLADGWRSPVGPKELLGRHAEFKELSGDARLRAEKLLGNHVGQTKLEVMLGTGLWESVVEMAPKTVDHDFNFQLSMIAREASTWGAGVLPTVRSLVAAFESGRVSLGTAWAAANLPEGHRLRECFKHPDVDPGAVAQAVLLSEVTGVMLAHDASWKEAFLREVSRVNPDVLGTALEAASDDEVRDVLAGSDERTAFRVVDALTGERGRAAARSVPAQTRAGLPLSGAFLAEVRAVVGPDPRALEALLELESEFEGSFGELVEACTEL
jgi:hypothetical protein